MPLRSCVEFVNTGFSVCKRVCNNNITPSLPSCLAKFVNIVQHKIQCSLSMIPCLKIHNPLFTGRSMGSRAAAALARQLSDESEDAVQGVICLSFPLHPPAQTHAHQQRSEDLKGLPEHMPVLFVSGTEDNMCDRVRTVCHYIP